MDKAGTDLPLRSSIIDTDKAAAEHRPPQEDDPQSFKSLLLNATDKALDWLSNATNEQLGACLVGLGASTYLVFGRVGLVLIGVVSGVVLHATWESSNGNGSAGGDARIAETSRRREVGLDVAKRVLDWREKKTSISSQDGLDALGLGIAEPQKATDFSDFKPDTAAALNDFCDAVVRDYVNYWYSPVLPNELGFPQSCRKILTSFILSLSNNLARKRPADSFIEFTTNSSSIVIVFLNELSAALSSSPNSSAPDAVATYLRMKPQCNLASIMDQKHQQRKLQMVADDILESYLDPAVYRTSVSRIFLQKILAHVILEMTIEKCSRAEWINEWIVYLLEEGEPELMNVIDAGVEGSAAGAITAKSNGQLSPSSADKARSPQGRQHSRTVSKAEEAMDEAMREAKRLTQMIQEEEERRLQDRDEQDKQTTSNAVESGDSSDTTTTHGIQTPTSSQSDTNGDHIQAPTPPPEPEQEMKKHGHAHSKSVLEGEQPLEAASPHEEAAFTSFDQLAPHRVPTALSDEQQAQMTTPDPGPLTLHKATIVLFDDSQPGDKKAIKSKPTTDYLIQIEPASKFYSGWMIPRTYADFETLHEVLVRISKITGVQFATLHPNLPPWKGATKPQLKDELERYLADAMRFEQLAESEGMKRFLEKSRGLTQEQAKGFWPNPANMGKGMIDVLAKAPNQVAGGGKAFFGGVAGVFTGGINPVNKRQTMPVPPKSPVPGDAQRSQVGSSVDLSSKSSLTPKTVPERLSVDQENLRKPPSSVTSGGSRPTLEPRRSSSMKNRQGKSTSVSPRPSITLERRHSAMTTASDFSSPDTPSGMQLPPPPEDMPDEYDYSSPVKAPIQSSRSGTDLSKYANAGEHISHMSVDGTSFFDVPTPPTPRSPRPQSPAVRSPPSRTSLSMPRQRSPNPAAPSKTADSAEKAKAAEARRTAPLSEQEAQVTIELLFAVITELYTMSSAWTLRRTLLGAAKTFLLRPGNPQLESIRVLLQETLLDANTNDNGIAAHVRKLRENTLPTEAELATWPKERSAEEKESLRIKARDLLVKRGMPQALTSVMGAAASGEALGKVFDCLQQQDLARGLMFGLLLQGVRTVTQ